jgi:hypothetical protein
VSFRRHFVGSLTFFVVVPLCAYSQIHNPNQRDYLPHVVVDVPLQDWQDGILSWLHHDPSFDRTKKNSPYQVKMPILNLYAPDGHPLYEGVDAKKNAQFLDQLQTSIPSIPQIATSQSTPSFYDYLEIVPQLKPYKSEIINAHRLTILAVTFPDRPFCQPENDSLHKLQASAAAKKIQIIEVRLHL